jgi:hypothetical protein
MTWDEKALGPMPEAVRRWEDRMASKTEQPSKKQTRACIAALKEMLILVSGRFEGATMRAEQAEAELAALKRLTDLLDGDRTVDRIKELEAEVAKIRESFRLDFPGAGDPFLFRARYDELTVENEDLKVEVEKWKRREWVCPVCGESMMYSRDIKKVAELEADLAYAIEARDKSEAWAIAECKVRGEAEAERDALLLAAYHEAGGFDSQKGFTNWVAGLQTTLGQLREGGEG